eukprot:scaffold10715_cov114-Isochrysis_galbana.AAC.23
MAAMIRVCIRDAAGLFCGLRLGRQAAAGQLCDPYKAPLASKARAPRKRAKRRSKRACSRARHIHCVSDGSRQQPAAAQAHESHEDMHTMSHRRRDADRES